MLIVSKEFQKAIRKPSRQTRISLVLELYNDEGEEMRYGLGDDAVVQKSLTITDQFTGGKFCYGSVYARNMSVKIDSSKIPNLDPININLTNAKIEVRFYLTLADGSEEVVFLGRFLIDSTRASRKFDILSLYGSDIMTKLDVPSEAMTNATPYEIYKRACELAGIKTYMSEDNISSLPNGDMLLTFDTKQIQSARDMIMWVAELTGTFARATLETYARIKLVQIRTKYTKSGTANNFDLETFKNDNGTIIPADIRFSTEFTDTSVRVTTVTMKRQGTSITSHRNWTFAKNTLEGTMELESNPILENKINSEVQTVVDNIQDYTDDLRFCPFKTTFNGNPAVETGDFVYLEPGGAIDETRFRHYGIVTYSKWVYRGKCEIRCATDMTAERPVTTSTASVMRVNGMAKTAPRTAAETFGVQPKSQLEKSIDALSGRENNSLVSINGSKLSLVPNAYSSAFSAPDQLIASVSDNGAVMAKSINSFLNVFPGNTYFKTSDNNGEKLTTSINRDGISYTREGGSKGNGSFSIEITTDEYGSQNGFIIYAGNQSMAVRNGHLYINGAEKI